jgi:hypothetical protein
VKLALALVALVVAGVVAALALALHSSRDPLPDRVAACVEKAGGHRIRGPEGLAFARADITARRMRTAGRLRLGEDSGLLLAGAGYGVLVLSGRNGPSLRGDVPLAIYRDASRYALVATERAPVHGVLSFCADRER